MRITSELLNKNKIVFDNLGYQKEPILEVYQYLVDFINTGEYPYNAQVLEYIIDKEQLELSIDEKEYLNTEVYLAQQKRHVEEQEQKHQKIINAGWKLFTGKEAEQLEGKSINWLFDYDIDFIQGTKEDKYKLKQHNNAFYLMKPRARSRGLLMQLLSNRYYYKL